MRRSLTILISCGLAISCTMQRARSASASPPLSQAMARQPFVGAWRLVSIDYSGPGGALTDPVFGPNPQGIIIYDQSGWMSVQIVTANRPVMTRPASRTSGVMAANDATLAAAAFNTYYAYFGTWDYDADTSVITHHLKSSLLPYETGRDYGREVRFDGALLKLIARSEEGGQKRERTLVWTRISDVGLNAAPSAVPLPSAKSSSPTPDSAASLALAELPQPAPMVTKYGDMPNDYRQTIQTYFLEHLKYPDAVQYREIAKPEQGYTTSVAGGLLMSEMRNYGWKVKATINTKNINNNYTGFKTYTFLFRGENIIDARSPLPGDEMK